MKQMGCKCLCIKLLRYKWGYEEAHRVINAAGLFFDEGSGKGVNKCVHVDFWE